MSDEAVVVDGAEVGAGSGGGDDDEGTLFIDVASFT